MNKSDDIVMEVITFETEAYKTINKRLDRVESVILQIEGKINEENISLLTSEQVCDFLKISRRTLSRLTKENSLPYYRNGRRLLFNRNDIEQYLKDNYRG